jgi:hypothetical protein
MSIKVLATLAIRHESENTLGPKPVDDHIRAITVLRVSEVSTSMLLNPS